MAEPIRVPGPDRWEESRQLAEVVAQLYRVCEIIVKNARQLVPGETVEELERAWVVSSESMRTLVNRLSMWDLPADARAAISDPRTLETALPPLLRQLKESELTGDVGAIKRAWLRRLIDRFHMYWQSEPPSPMKIRNAAEAGGEVMEAGATIVSSIPGYEKVVEILSLIKQLVGVRLRRGF